MARKIDAGRWWLFAALLFCVPQAASASPAVSANGRTITLAEPDLAKRERLLADGQAISLRVRGSEVELPLATSLDPDGSIVIEPRFPLLPDVEYILLVGDGRAHDLTVPAPDEDAPQVVSVSPGSAELPANLLRMHVRFSAPMARGQAGRLIAVLDESGARVDSPFLNLVTELWSSDQRQLTLLFDPGRLKRGVGPNRTHGAPLQEGGAYRLVVDKAFRSARGTPMKSEFAHEFRIGPAERRALDPMAWAVDRPQAGTRDPLRIAFDRPVDARNLARTLSLRSPAGTAIAGRPVVTSEQLVFVPGQPWTGETVIIAVAPGAEDTAGNRPCAPFDEAAGRARVCTETVTRRIEPLAPLP